MSPLFGKHHDDAGDEAGTQDTDWRHLPRLAEMGDALDQAADDAAAMPLTVHRRNGEPCPRCGDRLEAVFYEDYVMCYCPTCQTDGKLMKDRRLSRLLK